MCIKQGTNNERMLLLYGKFHDRRAAVRKTDESHKPWHSSRSRSTVKRLKDNARINTHSLHEYAATNRTRDWDFLLPSCIQNSGVVTALTPRTCLRLHDAKQTSLLAFVCSYSTDTLHEINLTVILHHHCGPINLKVRETNAAFHEPWISSRPFLHLLVVIIRLCLLLEANISLQKHMAVSMTSEVQNEMPNLMCQIFWNRRENLLSCTNSSISKQSSMVVWPFPPATVCENASDRTMPSHAVWTLTVVNHAHYSDTYVVAESNGITQRSSHERGSYTHNPTRINHVLICIAKLTKVLDYWRDYHAFESSVNDGDSKRKLLGPEDRPILDAQESKDVRLDETLVRPRSIVSELYCIRLRKGQWSGNWWQNREGMSN